MKSRGNRIFFYILGTAAASIDGAKDRYLSVQTYMELLQCARDKQQQRRVKHFISDLNFSVLPLTENIGHRALVYVEEHGLLSGMRAGDAIIAAMLLRIVCRS